MKELDLALELLDDEKINERSADKLSEKQWLYFRSLSTTKKVLEKAQLLKLSCVQDLIKVPHNSPASNTETAFIKGKIEIIADFIDLFKHVGEDIENDGD